MNADRQNAFEYFQHGSHRMLKDVNGRVFGIPGGAVLEAYLTVDKQNGQHAQVCFVTSKDLDTQSDYVSLWRSFLENSASSICPQVIEITDFDGLSCSICSLPSGEPINHFINRNGVLPAEVAVRLIIEFVTALQSHRPIFYRNYAIAAESIWITRTQVQPKIVLGNLSPVRHPNPEAHNAELCIELLKFLTGNPAKNKAFQGLVARLETGSLTLEFLGGTLSCFAEAHPPANYWMGYNDPDSLVERIIAVETASRTKQMRKEAAVSLVQRSIWPVAVMLTLFVGAFLIYCLIALPTEPFLQMVTGHPQVKYIEPAQTFPAPVQQVVPRYVAPPAPVVVQAPATPRVINAVPRSVITPSHHYSTAPSFHYYGEPRMTPKVKDLLAGTGDLFKEFQESPKSEWLIYPEATNKPKTGSSSTFTLEDERNLRLLELKKAASEAKRLNQPFEGVKIEVALLKLKPDLTESRIRLHDYLSQIQNMTIGDDEISQKEVEILVEASGENSKARDILNQHLNTTIKMIF